MGVPCLKWSYGVISCEKRLADLLPQTLISLNHAGFDKPTVFVDGVRDPLWIATELEKRSPALVGLNVIARWPQVRTVGNWMLAALELYLREPEADRYALFQDDMVTYRNLRTYLNASPYPTNAYLNLYTFPSNQLLAPANDGWYEARSMESGRDYHGKRQQQGRGAVALVFDRKAMMSLLAHQHMIDRQQDVDSRYKRLDGGIVETMNKAGFREYVHNPSLVQHTGIFSAMGNKQHPQATSFRGEQYDAMELMKKEP